MAARMLAVKLAKKNPFTMTAHFGGWNGWDAGTDVCELFCKVAAICRRICFTPS
jgi:hypothetical protein